MSRTRMVGTRIGFSVCILFAISLLLWRNSSKAMQAPTPPLLSGVNVNMAGGPVKIQTDDGTPTGNLAGLIEGDPFFTKQNELSFAISSRNNRHIVVGANDYRAVKVPFIDTPPAPGVAGLGDVWGGLFITLDQGKHWRSTLLPCYPQDQRPECASSPLHGFAAVADPQVRAGTHGLFYYCGIVFDRGENAPGAVFCSRFMDLNNVEGVDFPLSLPDPPDPDQIFSSPIQRIDDRIIQAGTAGQFLDKISAATDIVRQGFKTATLPVPLNCDPTNNPSCQAADGADGTVDGFVSQTIPCGKVYVAYADFTGNMNNPNSKLLVSRSADCGETWENATVVNQTQGVSQGAAVKVAPDGRVSVVWRQFGLDSEVDSIWIAHQDTQSRNKFKFNAAIKIAELRPVQNTEPFDLPTRAADLTDSSGNPVDDPYVGFRVNSYPTLAIDAGGRYYVAWSQRGWGEDVDGDGIVRDGARIVLTTSENGSTWTAPLPVDPQLPAAGGAPGQPADPTLTPPRGHQIMPHMSVVEGRVGMVFYDFRDDVFPGILSQLKSSQCDDPSEDLNGDGEANFVDCCILEVNNDGGADSSITVQDCERLDDPGFVESLIPADPANFSPLPIRHTVDTFFAEALPSATPAFTVRKVSDYTKVLVPKLTAGGIPIPGQFDVAQLRFHSASLPLYGGDKAFMGDYIEFNGADVIPSGGGWSQNLDTPACKAGVDCRPSPVAHVAFSDTRDVVPPEPTIELDSEGNQVLRQDWASDYVGLPGRARMLDQNPYTTRLTGGVVLGSPGNFKPLFGDSMQSRTYALILENTLNEGTLTATEWLRGSRFYRLSFTTPAGIQASFAPDFSIPSLDVEVQSLSAIGTTLFVRKIGGNNLSPRITVYANEIDAIGGAGFKNGGLQAFTIINPDPSNPLPVNVDLEDGTTDILTNETHTPEFVPFDCQQFLDVTGPSGVPDGQVDDPFLLNVFPQCEPTIDGSGNVNWPQLLALRTYWPDLVDPSRAFSLNASLFNASLFNASLFNPAVYSASLFNPALLDSAVYDWANASLFNASLFNASLFNASLFNASLFNASLFNPAIADAIRNASLFNASLFNASLFNASLFNASLFNASLFNASLFNASLFNASLLNASLFNASLFNASLFNNPVNGPVDGSGAGSGGIFPAEQVYNSAIFSGAIKNGARIVDVNWEIQALANTNSGYFFWPLFQRLPDNAQLIIRRVSQSQTVTRDPDCLANSEQPENCPLKTFPIFDQEILANILNLPDFLNLNPQVLNQLLLQATFVAPPGGRIFITLRGTCIPDSANPLICEGGYDPFLVDGVAVPQAEDDGLSATWTVLEEEPSVSTAYNTPVTITAKVGTNGETLPVGSVELLVDGISVGTGVLQDVGGQAKASITFTPSDFALHVSGSPYSMRARYHEGAGFKCGLGSGTDPAAGCFSQSVELVVRPAVVGTSDIDPGVLIEIGTCDTGAFSNGIIEATYDGSPVEVCAQSATDEFGNSVLPPSVSFQISYQDVSGNDLGEPPQNAGTYQVTISISDANGDFSGVVQVTLVIGKGSASLILGGLAAVYDGTPHAVTVSTDPLGLEGVSVNYDGSPNPPVDAGSYLVVAALDNANWAADNVTGTLVISKAQATLQLGSLAATYDGSPHPVSVSTNPLGLEGVSVNYDGSPVPPVDAGSYLVVAALDNPNWVADDVTGTLVISKAQATLQLGSLAATYDGSPHPVSVSTDPLGLEGVSVNYDGSPVPPVDAGSYLVVAALDNPNWVADDVTGTLVISKAQATLQLGNLAAVYDGSPHPVTVTTSPPDLVVVSVTYDGAATAPVNAGAYAVVATLANDNWQATDATGILVISKAAQSIDFQPLPDRNVTEPPFVVSAAATSGLPVSFSVTGPATVAGNLVTLTGIGRVEVTASQEGDVNYLPADPVSQAFLVSFVEFVGFGPPVGGAGDTSDPDSVPYVGSYSINKTLTLKWELFKEGVEVFDLDFIHSIKVSDATPAVGNSCSYNPVPAITLYPTCLSSGVCAGGTELRSSTQYVFNWKLSSSSGDFVPLGCRTVFLNVGSAASGAVYMTKAVTIQIQ